MAPPLWALFKGKPKGNHPPLFTSKRTPSPFVYTSPHSSQATGRPLPLHFWPVFGDINKRLASMRATRSGRNNLSSDILSAAPFWSLGFEIWELGMTLLDHKPASLIAVWIGDLENGFHITLKGSRSPEIQIINQGRCDVTKNPSDTGQGDYRWACRSGHHHVRVPLF